MNKINRSPALSSNRRQVLDITTPTKKRRADEDDVEQLRRKDRDKAKSRPDEDELPPTHKAPKAKKARPALSAQTKRDLQDRDREKELKRRRGGVVEEEVLPRERTRKEIAKSMELLPRKMKKSQLPALLQNPTEKRISKLSGSKMHSILGDAAEEIHQLLERDSNESASSLLQKRLVQATLDMLPYAENTIRETEGARGVYQYNSLITSIRELLIDMQANRDKGAIGELVVEKVMRPAFTDIATYIVTEDSMLGNFIKSRVDPKVFKEIEDEKHATLMRIAATVQRKFDDARTAAVELMKQ